MNALKALWSIGTSVPSLLAGPYGILIRIGAILLIAVGLFVYGYVKGATHEHANTIAVQAKYDGFVSQVAARGAAALAVAKAKIAQDKANKEKADAENKRTRDAYINTIIKLRRERENSGGGKLPAAPAGSSRPDLICFDRTAYQSAYGSLVTEVRGLADEGTESTIDLNTAKAWAGGLK